jgi:hypothetical protein
MPFLQRSKQATNRLWLPLGLALLAEFQRQAGAKGLSRLMPRPPPAKTVSVLAGNSLCLGLDRTCLIRIRLAVRRIFP